MQEKNATGFPARELYGPGQNAYGSQLADELEARGVLAELAASIRVAQWAYGQTEQAKGLTWLRADEMVPLDHRWRHLLV
jgi:hypothetical protein